MQNSQAELYWKEPTVVMPCDANPQGSVSAGPDVFLMPQFRVMNTLALEDQSSFTDIREDRFCLI